MMVSGSLRTCRCKVHSSTHTTSTTARGSERHAVWAARKAGNAALHPMNPKCMRDTSVGRPRSLTTRTSGPGAKNPVQDTVITCVTSCGVTAGAA